MIDPQLPLLDLHRHLEGSIRLTTVLELAQCHALPLPAPDLAGLRTAVQVTVPQPGVMAFIEKIIFMVSVLADYEACRRVAYENVEDAYNEGLDYLELRFSPWFMAEAHRLNPAAVVEAVVDGVRTGAQTFGIAANLIGILSRTYGPALAWKELEALYSFKHAIAGLDLAGDEANQPGALFVEHFKKARAAGWAITVHAGESAGSESIWQAIKELGAQRVGHAVQAINDARLLDYMAEQRIGVEANLTSNVQTATVSGYQVHPLKTFLARGILATINTDDPGISNITLRHEYEQAGPRAGLTKEELRQAQDNAVTIAFLSDAEKRALRSKKNLLRVETLPAASQPFGSRGSNQL